jgi:hypothetical protein
MVDKNFTIARLEDFYSNARKYALNGLFLIDDTKDADATNTHGNEKPVSKLKPLPDDKFNDAVKFLKGGKTMDEIKKKYLIDEETEFKLITASE